MLKKFFSFLILVFSCFVLASCDFLNDVLNDEKIDDNKDQEVIDNQNDDDNQDDGEELTDKSVRNFEIYCVNDFHGMIDETENGVGLSKLFKKLKEYKDNGALIVSSGDMFQGSAVSSMSRGRVVVDAMNYVGFDCMAIGNHEFDWGIETVMNYQDKDASNGEANFPFLCANCIVKETNQLADWCIPYTVVEKQGIKIGIIGVIGQDEESDILRSYVDSYDFTDEFEALKKYSYILRTKEKCDLVIASCHCDTSSINNRLVSLTGNYKIDVILNGHTHQSYYGECTRNDGTIVPYIQSGCYGKYIGKVALTYDPVSKKVTNSSATNLYAFNTCTSEDENINSILNNYSEFVNISREVLGVSNTYIYKDLFGNWASNALMDYFKVDIGICNTGGIRGSGFPINDGQEVTYGDIFEIMPFENMVVTLKLKGKDIKNEILRYSNSYYISSKYDLYSLDNEIYYTIATVDYVYYKYAVYYATGIDGVNSNILFREVLVETFKKSLNNGKFYC